MASEASLSFCSCSAPPWRAASTTQWARWSSSSDERERLERLGRGGDLGQDVDAVLLVLDHPLDPADLPLDPAQPLEVGLDAASLPSRCPCDRSWLHHTPRGYPCPISHAGLTPEGGVGRSIHAHLPSRCDGFPLVQTYSDDDGPGGRRGRTTVRSSSMDRRNHMIIRVALLGGDELVRRGLDSMLRTLGGFELGSIKERVRRAHRHRARGDLRPAARRHHPGARRRRPVHPPGRGLHLEPPPRPRRRGAGPRRLGLPRHEPDGRPARPCAPRDPRGSVRRRAAVARALRPGHRVPHEADLLTARERETLPSSPPVAATTRSRTRCRSR